MIIKEGNKMVTAGIIAMSISTIVVVSAMIFT